MTSPVTSAWVPTTRWIESAFDLGELFAARRLRRRPGQQRDAKARGLEQPRDVGVVLLREDLGRRHERHLQTVLHRDQRREQRDDRLAGADVPLQQPVHRPRLLQIVDDFLQRVLLTVGQLERQHRARRVADAIVDANRQRLLLGRRGVAARQHAHLKDEGFLENQTPLRRGRERVQRLDRQVGGRKVCGHQGGVARRQPEANAHVLWQRIGKFGRQLLQNVEDQPPLHLRRDGARLLVHRHDAPGVDRLAFLVIEDFVLRVGDLQADRAAHLDQAVEHHVLAAHEDIFEVRLVQPRRPQRSGPVVDRRLEDLEPRAPR